VWDLILYNFQCRNPAEVNWCMQELLGCTKLSPDGRNFSFSPTDRNPVLFIPPVGWEFLTFRAPAAQRLVMEALAGPDIDALRFKLGALEVDPGLYAQVRRHVGSMTILVDAFPTGAGSGALAFYDPVINTLLVRDPASRSAAKRAEVVHEATHAGFDIRHAGGFRVDGEACGYVAQMMIVLNDDPSWPTLNPFGPAFARRGAHIQWATHIAQRVLRHILTSLTLFTLPYHDRTLVALRTEIARLPQHKLTAWIHMRNDGV